MLVSMTKQERQAQQQADKKVMFILLVLSVFVRL